MDQDGAHEHQSSPLLKQDSPHTSLDTRTYTLIESAQVLGRQPPRTMRTHEGSSIVICSVAPLAVHTGPDPATRRMVMNSAAENQ